MSTNGQCPLCEEGQLHEYTEKTTVNYHGHTAQLDSYYAVCDACDAEQATADQVRRNKRTMMAFKKSVDGLLSGSQVRLLREQLRITQTQAAQIFGGGPVAFSKYESDDVMQSEAMDKLLRLAAAVPEAFEHLVREAGITLSAHQPQWQDITPSPALPSSITRPQLRLVHSQSLTGELQRKYA